MVQPGLADGARHELTVRGRTRELAALGRLLDDARRQRGGVLVVRGDAGIGKSALLDHAARTAIAHDMTVLRATGVEGERGLPFAGLHLLLRSHLDRIDTLPGPQEAAVRAAMGLDGAARTEAMPGDRFLVGMAVLNLLTDLAEHRPVLCILDDAHWLDAASSEALLFAARRLDADRVAMLFAVREPHVPPLPTPGLPGIVLRGLDDAAADAILAETAAELPRYVRDQIRAEAEGNPLALLELPVGYREGYLTDGAVPTGTGPLSAAMPGSERIRHLYADRITALPERCQTLLLLAAAEPTGDPGIVLAAADSFGAEAADLEPAERRSLIREVDGRLRFHHPLVRAAAYHGAPLSRRLAAHRALSGAFDAVGETDRSVWHLAAAATGPDDQLAARLERTADQARLRGGYAAVAEALERAADLTSEHGRRAERLAAASRAAVDAGRLTWAATLADRATYATGAAAGHHDLAAQVAAVQAAAVRVRADVAVAAGEPWLARDRLADAVRSLAPSHPDIADQLLFDAVEAAWFIGDLDTVTELVAPGTWGEWTPDPRAAALARVATGLTALSVDGTGGGIAALRELLLLGPAHRSAEGRRLADLRFRARQAWWHLMVGDCTQARDLTLALERDCRANGAIGVLPRALALLARAEMFAGRTVDARAAALDGLAIATATGQDEHARYHTLVLAHLDAISGDDERCHARLAELTTAPSRTYRTWAACVRSLLDLGHGRHDLVLQRLREVTDTPARLDALSSLPDLIEAASRLRQPEVATESLARYESWANHVGQDWAAAVALRCRALLTDGASAAADFAKAVDLHRADPARPFERARTELLFGEWLRRAGRRAAARPVLRSSADIFARIGARPWAERARTELRATGESITSDPDRRGAGPVAASPASRSLPELLAALTPQELRMVRMAADGLSNRDIGERLFLSPRTVGYHLSNAYPKLGVTSRGELIRLGLAHVDPHPGRSTSSGAAPEGVG